MSSASSPSSKAYLGDGAYAEFTEQGLVLTTEDGVRVTNTVVLEPEVLEQLLWLLSRRLGSAVWRRFAVADGVPFTQFLRPDGRRRAVVIDRPADIADKAQALIARGLALEIEELTTGEVSMAVENHLTEETVAIRTCPNGPEVPPTVDALITEAHGRVFG